MISLQDQTPSASRPVFRGGWFHRLFALLRGQEAEATSVAPPVAAGDDNASPERCHCFSQGISPSKCELLAMSILTMGM
jgi:hypothetical protein